MLIAPVSREFFGIDNLNVAVGMNFTGASVASFVGPFLSSYIVQVRNCFNHVKSENV